MKSWKDDPRADTNPLFNDNKLKLGLFGLNSGAQIMTQAPERLSGDWARSDLATAAMDHLGLEAMVSLMGWEPRAELEPFTWAAGLLARHARPAVISTMHISLNHPVFVAKAAATVDLISRGRFAINLVAGVTPTTFNSFGAQLEDHETRYARAAEFTELLHRLWSSDESFDFEGRFYKLSGVLSLPKPVQFMPALMNAGTSGRGRQFACKYADLVFTHLEADDEQARAQIKEYKRIARDDYGREVQIWTHGYIVLRDTEAEAESFLKHYATDHADHERVARWVAALGAAQETQDPAQAWKINRHWAAGGGLRLVGTADQVAERLARLSGLGLDGILWNTIEPENLLIYAKRHLLPRLVQLGLRRTG